MNTTQRLCSTVFLNVLLVSGCGGGVKPTATK